MNRSFHHGVIAFGVLLATGWTAAAQGTAGPAANPHRERMGIGVNGMLALGAKPWSIVSVRVGVPASEKLGLDVDVGHVFGAGDLARGWIPRGSAVAVHLRWKPKGRSSGGTSGYLLVGPRFVQGTDEERGGSRTNSAFNGMDLGAGVDHALANGMRIGAEVGNGSAGEAALPFLNGFVLFGRRP